jgi:hypothetical protein
MVTATSFQIFYEGTPIRPEFNMVTIPGTDMIYFISYLDRSGVFYFNPSVSTTANFYPIADVMDLQDLCVVDTTILYVMTYASTIVQVNVDISGNPISQTPLSGSSAKTQKRVLAYDSITSTLIVCNNLTEFYIFASGTYTPLTISGFLGCNYFMQYFGAYLYIIFDNIIYKTELSDTTLTAISSIEFPYIPYGMAFSNDDTMYVGIYADGGTTSYINSISNISSPSPGSPVVFYSGNDIPPTDGLWLITLSSPDLGLLYASNYDNYTFLSIPLQNTEPYDNTIEIYENPLKTLQKPGQYHTYIREKIINNFDNL